MKIPIDAVLAMLVCTSSFQVHSEGRYVPKRASSVFCISVATKSPDNPKAKFWCRSPKGYDGQRRKPYSVLVYFGGRNCQGKEEASGKLGWSSWSDENDVFLVCPGFQNDKYWEPEKWSGEALFSALSTLKKKWNIDTSKIMYYGYSAGSQASNLFAAWRPARCAAWVSHACGMFHEPMAAMRRVPGLATCGDADAARYVIGRDFVERARRKGENVIWKSFPNRRHDVPEESLLLARAFFRWRKELRENCFATQFIGDDADGVYYPVESPEADLIESKDKVLLPDKFVADAWGRGILVK